MGSLTSLIGGGAPKGPAMPPPPAAPPPSAAPASPADSQVAKAGASQRNRAAAAASTIGKAGPSGLSKPPKTANVELLGD